MTYPLATSTVDDLEPTISSPTDVIDGRRTYLAAWHNGGTGPEQTFGRLMTGTTAVTPASNLSSRLGHPTTRPATSPTADSDGCRFALGFEDLFDPGTGGYDVYVGTAVRPPGLPGVGKAGGRTAPRFGPQSVKPRGPSLDGLRETGAPLRRDVRTTRSSGPPAAAIPRAGPPGGPDGDRGFEPGP